MQMWRKYSTIRNRITTSIKREIAIFNKFDEFILWHNVFSLFKMVLAQELRLNRIVVKKCCSFWLSEVELTKYIQIVFAVQMIRHDFT